MARCEPGAMAGPAPVAGMAPRRSGEASRESCSSPPKAIGRGDAPFWERLRTRSAAGGLPNPRGFPRRCGHSPRAAIQADSTRVPLACHTLGCISFLGRSTLPMRASSRWREGHATDCCHTGRFGSDRRLHGAEHRALPDRLGAVASGACSRMLSAPVRSSGPRTSYSFHEGTQRPACFSVSAPLLRF